MSHSLHPAWLQDYPGTDTDVISDLTLVDSLDTVLQEINAIGLLLHTYAHDKDSFNSTEAIDGASLILCHRVKEISEFLELWHGQKRTAPLRTVDGGES